MSAATSARKQIQKHVVTLARQRMPKPELNAEELEELLTFAEAYLNSLPDDPIRQTGSPEIEALLKEAEAALSTPHESQL